MNKRIYQQLTERSVHITLLCALCTLLTLVPALYNPFGWGGFIGDGERYVYDHLVRVGRVTVMDTNLVLIGIDHSSYEDFVLPAESRNSPALGAMCSRFPWNRMVWAELVSKLAEAGAKTVALDLIFASASDGDEEFRAVLDKYKDRVVIGSTFTPEVTDRGTNTTFMTPSSTLIVDRVGKPAALDSRVGYINIWADVDDVFRSSRYRGSNHSFNDVVNAPPDSVLYSFDARVLQKYSSDPKLADQLEPRSLFRYAGPAERWKVIPVVDLMTPKIWKANFGNGTFFKNKLV